MTVAISCAVMFLRGYRYETIRSKSDMGPAVTKARIQQYISKGCQFLMERGVLQPPKKSNGKRSA